MICPNCKRPTSRMVYKRDGKLCPECNDPGFIRLFEIPDVLGQSLADISRIHEIIFAAQNPKPAPLETLRCIINPQTRTLK